MPTNERSSRESYRSSRESYRSNKNTGNGKYNQFSNLQSQTSSTSNSRVSRDIPFDLNDEVFSSEQFRMYQYKVKRCPRARAHDWTMCPFAHPNEKAKRRDPQKFWYIGIPCPEYKKNNYQCSRGDCCSFAHGVFECWLHPAKYKTQMCTDGSGCKRKVCFFAHYEHELRAVKPKQQSFQFQLDVLFEDDSSQDPANVAIQQKGIALKLLALWKLMQESVEPTEESIDKSNQFKQLVTEYILLTNDSQIIEKDQVGCENENHSRVNYLIQEMQQLLVPKDNSNNSNIQDTNRKSISANQGSNQFDLKKSKQQQQQLLQQQQFNQESQKVGATGQNNQSLNKNYQRYNQNQNFGSNKIQQAQKVSAVKSNSNEAPSINVSQPKNTDVGNNEQVQIQDMSDLDSVINQLKNQVDLGKDSEGAENTEGAKTKLSDISFTEFVPNQLQKEELNLSQSMASSEIATASDITQQ